MAKLSDLLVSYK
jgi:flagellum-specific peptidoglycan hydrolase FlgJ